MPSRQMSRPARPERARAVKAVLSIKGLNVFYGQSHCLQGIDLELASGILAVVGRNGMGKSTLCNSIMGLNQPASGSIRYCGLEIGGRPPNEICTLGIGYVPQGRRVWPSLTVHEHLKLALQAAADALWTIDRVYQTFPRLAERRNTGGGQLSGGEQQMLAIARALLVNPALLIMDEPTEGLAPVIVEQVERMLLELADEDQLSVLLIEQNMGVATAVSEQVAVMVNGQIHRLMPAAELAADLPLQQRLLGVGRHDEEPPEVVTPSFQPDTESEPAQSVQYYSMQSPPPADRQPQIAAPNRWGIELAAGPLIAPSIAVDSPAETGHGSATGTATIEPLLAGANRSVEQGDSKTVLVVGTYDTKADELNFIRDEIGKLGVAVRRVDVSTSQKTSRCEVTPLQVASHHARGSGHVFSGDRGQSIAAMCDALVNWISRQRDISGIISAGGSGGTALVTPAMRALAVGVPKVMISTVASGEVGQYVGPSDIMMLHSVTDVQGINSISRQILRNGANAVAGAVKGLPDPQQREREFVESLPSVGISMFGVTTACVQKLTAQLAGRFDCLVFHCTGTGGRSLEKLVDSEALAAVIDVTTTEIADFHVGGVFSAGSDRLGAFARTHLPYLGSCGALDMVNFGAMETVPEQFRQRNLYEHNPQVTLMRTTAAENRWMGEWIGRKLNQMQGPVRFLIPEGGVSSLDQPGQVFYDAQADAALFDALTATVQQTAKRKLIRVAANINDDLFVERLLESFFSIYKPSQRKRA